MPTKILSKMMFTILSSAVLTGCVPIMYFFSNCADWNCNHTNPRWVKAVRECGVKNRTVVLQELGSKLGYSSRSEVQDSDIGLHISVECSHGGRYDIKKDEKYRHLFEK